MTKIYSIKFALKIVDARNAGYEIDCPNTSLKHLREASVEIINLSMWIAYLLYKLDIRCA